jgi:hypothetical protein
MNKTNDKDWIGIPEFAKNVNNDRVKQMINDI